MNIDLGNLIFTLLYVLYYIIIIIKQVIVFISPI